MERRKIGETGLSVTPLGFGSSGLGNMPDTYGYEVSAEQARATVEAIFDGPVNLLDTSNNYGFGRSEARIGEVIRDRGGLPDGFVLSTKLDRDMETGRFDADRAWASLEESLTRLSLDRVPLLHLHDPEHARDLGEVSQAIDTLFRMKEEGLAQAVGLAMGRLDILEPILRDHPFDALISHNRWTVVNQSAGAIFAQAAARGIAILNAAPYAGGVLAKGSIQMPRVTYQPGTDATLAPIRAIEALASRHDVSPGAVALQVSLRSDHVTSTIAGVSKPDRIAQTLGWMDEKIPDALWAEIAEIPPSLDDPEANRDYRPG